MVSSSDEFLRFPGPYLIKMLPKSIRTQQHYCSLVPGSLLQGLQEILLASFRLFARSGTDKSMCIPDNNIHLRYTYLVASVLGGFVSYPAILGQFRGLQEPAVLFTGDIVTRLTRSWGGFMKSCEPAKGYLLLPEPTSLCAYLAILFTCGTAILLTRSWWGCRKICQLAKGCLPVPGPTSTCNIVHLRYSNPFDPVLWGLQENLLACQRLFASSGTDTYLQYFSLLIELSC